MSPHAPTLTLLKKHPCTKGVHGAQYDTAYAVCSAKQPAWSQAHAEIRRLCTDQAHIRSTIPTPSTFPPLGCGHGSPCAPCAAQVQVQGRARLHTRALARRSVGHSLARRRLPCVPGGGAAAAALPAVGRP